MKLTYEQETIQDDETLTSEIIRFVELFQNSSIVDYSKIETSNNQLLDKGYKNIITFFWQKNGENSTKTIIEDVLKETPDISQKAVYILSAKTIKDRTYLIIFLPFSPEVVVEYVFSVLYKGQHKFDINNLKICGNIGTTPTIEEIPHILQHYLGKIIYLAVLLKPLFGLKKNITERV